MNYEDFCEFMDTFVRHAGHWHDEGCPFVYTDHGVCNCKLYENDGAIRQLFEDITSDK